MASALVALATTTLASSSATVTFSSISGSYRDLRLVVNYGLSVTGKQINFTVNSDTGSNYYEVGATGYSTSTLSWADSPTTKFSTMRATGLALGDISTLTVDFLDYSVTDKQKTMLARTNHPGEVSMLAGRWASTSAITTIQFLPEAGGGNFVTGSTFSLYGVVS